MCWTIGQNPAVTAVQTLKVVHVPVKVMHRSSGELDAERRPLVYQEPEPVRRLSQQPPGPRDGTPVAT